jgi:hypothetical protein
MLRRSLATILAPVAVSIGAVAALPAAAAAANLPRGTRSVTATALQGRHRGETVRLTSRRAVRAVVHDVNALAPLPPGAYSCPDDLGPVARLAFRDARGELLARAVVDRTGCREVTVRVAGHRARHYAGGDALARELAPLLPDGFIPAQARPPRQR